MISYFLSPQIEYSYQYDKSIRIDFSQTFAILSNPTGIATDNSGNVVVMWMIVDNGHERMGHQR